MSITVAICTYRPRKDHIEKTLQGLRAQTLPTSEWSLAIICDDVSRATIESCGLAWHPQAYILREAGKGIAQARLQALRHVVDETSSDVMLFLDDDNVLAPDFLAVGRRLADANPKLGCWGGQLLGQFDVPPESWTEPFLKYLAIFPLSAPRVATAFAGNYDAVPPCAGMFLRREVAVHFLRQVAEDPKHLALGGTRQDRIGAEDMDIGLTAFDVGMSVGRFPELKLHHLMPADRLTEEYLAMLIASIRAGTIVLEAVRGIRRPQLSRFALWRDWLRAHRLPAREKRFMLAEVEGEFRARRILKAYNI